jgi:predicted RNA-binding protein with PUA-like domain
MVLILREMGVAKAAGGGGWLFKEEPTNYSFAELERDRTTLWDGVDNNMARKYLRQVKTGDRVFFYHTGKEKAVVGEMAVVEGPMADPAADDPKAVMVRVQAKRRLKNPVTLKRIKEEPSLASWELVKNSRLSVMPVNASQWRKIEQMAGEI